MTETSPSKSDPRTLRVMTLCGVLLLPIALGGTLAGCAGASSSSLHRPPAAVTVPGEAEVEGSLGPTRERLIKVLAAEGLVLDEVEAGGPVLLLALETNQPETYVNCGRTHTDYTSPRGEAEAADVPIAGSAQYKTAGAAGEPLRIDHRAQLRADARVVLTALGARTRVAVNTRYRLAITDITQPLDRDARPAGAVTKAVTVLRFTSDQPAAPQDGRPGCTTTGALEWRILDAARG